MRIKYKSKAFSDGTYLNPNDLIPISKTKCFKIDDHGDDLISGLSKTDINLVDFIGITCE